MTIKSRVLETVLSRHSIKDLCNSSSQLICYSSSMEQQRERTKYVSKHQNKEQKRIMAKDIGKLWMYTYGNRQTTSQIGKN